MNEHRTDVAAHVTEQERVAAEKARLAAELSPAQRARAARLAADRAAAAKLLAEREQEYQRALANYIGPSDTTPSRNAIAPVRREHSPWKIWGVRFAIVMVVFLIVDAIVYLAFFRQRPPTSPVAIQPIVPARPASVPIPTGPTKEALIERYQVVFANWMQTQADKATSEKSASESLDPAQIALAQAHAYYLAHEETKQLLPPAADRLEQVLKAAIDYSPESVPVDARRGTEKKDLLPTCFGAQEEKDQFLKEFRLYQRYGQKVLRVMRENDVVLLHPLDHEDIQVGQVREISTPIEVLHTDDLLLRVVRIPSGQDLALVGPSDLPESGQYDPTGKPHYAIVRYEDAMANVQVSNGRFAKTPMAAIVEVQTLVDASSSFLESTVLDGVALDEWKRSGFLPELTMKFLVGMVKSNTD